MSSTILFDTDFPHGKPSGFKAGCHGSACPAPIPCRTVYLRYNGDYAFRKRIDAGIPAATIVAEEAAAAEQARIDEIEARRRARLAARGAGRTAQPKANRVRAVNENIARVAAAHAEGLTDKQIGARLNLHVTTVGLYRRSEGLLPNRAPQGQPLRTEAAKKRGDMIEALNAEGLTDKQIAERTGLSVSTVINHRRQRKLTVNRKPIERRRPFVEKVAELHAKGLSDTQIATELGIHFTTAGRTRRELGLPLIVARRSSKRAQIRERIAQGEPVAEVAAALNVGRRYVLRAIREAKSDTTTHLG